MLDENIKKYAELQEEIDRLTKEASSLKATILDEMGLFSSVSTKEGYIASVSKRETIKYNDELGIIKYLEDNHLNEYITKKVDSTKLNKEIKKSTTLNESLKPMFTTTTTYALSVKKKAL